jgi:prepilin-type N-terminal cleavage/methylation domain-containing protein
MTLVEMMIALAIVGIVFSVCYGSSIALQRSFGFTTAWAETRTTQLRVLDSLAVDLRNATKIDFTSPAPTLVKLTIPNRYSSYQATGALAGDPAPTANPTAAPTPDLFGKITYTNANTITVTYALSADGKTITRRAADWPVGPATTSATREIATFPNTAAVTFTPNSPTIMTNASNITVMTANITAAPDGLHPDNQSILKTQVFLRELSIK